MKYSDTLEIATKLHKGQKRWNGDDYITHPIRVASAFKDIKLIQIALLHDVIEDTNVTESELIKKYKIDEHNASIILILTKRDDEKYSNYILRVKSDVYATLIKIEDLKDNLKDLKDGQRKDKYELALAILEKTKLKI